MAGEETANSLVFTGSMDWLPNEDAIFYFVESILPLIKLQCRRCLASGRPQPIAQTSSIAETREKHRLTGWVNDIRPFVARGAVCIVPLRIGGGTRLKIFEAMAMGKAVVSTSVGAEGLAVRPVRIFFWPIRPDDFAESVSPFFAMLDGGSKLERRTQWFRKTTAGPEWRMTLLAPCKVRSRAHLRGSVPSSSESS